MDLIRSPSRTYIESQPPTEYYRYSHSTLPSHGIRVRGHDYSGYETDTGLMTSRGYGPRYYRAPPPPPPPPMHPYYRQYEGHRSMFRPDGYDTDSGLISSGRLRMTRTLPPRMAVIPETVVLNNRMVSSTNLNTIPTNLRNSSFLNQTNRSENFTGYDTDSGMNTRAYRPIPVDVQYGDHGWTGNQSMTKANYQQKQQQHQQRFMDNNQRYHQTQEQLRSTSIPVFSHHSEQQQKRVRIIKIFFISYISFPFSLCMECSSK
jgi:hypothetical protein